MRNVCFLFHPIFFTRYCLAQKWITFNNKRIKTLDRNWYLQKFNSCSSMLQQIVLFHFRKSICMKCWECKVMHYICICVCHTQICNVRRRKKTHIFDKGQCNDLLQNTQLSEEYKTPKNAKSLSICSFLQRFYIYITITLKGMQKGTFLCNIVIHLKYNLVCILL